MLIALVYSLGFFYLEGSITGIAAANVAQNTIRFSFDSVTGLAIADQGGSTDKVVLIPILIGVIIIMNVAWYIYTRRKRKEKN